MRAADRTRAALVACALVILAGCQSTPTRQNASRPTEVMRASAEVPEDQLLDVGIQVFEPGEVSEADADEGVFSSEVRDAEARYIPVHLKQTLQRSGHWGAVRVLPEESDSVDLMVSGRIVDSDGEKLTVSVTAVDATGREWFTRDYHTGIGQFAYDDARRGERDPFQNLYNTVANDLAVERNGMSPEQVTAVREVSELRFATDLAPDAFDGYLVETAEGRRVAARLPARDDPMLVRVRRIRERDYMLVDTVNGHYDAYYADIWQPYLSFRKLHAEEAKQLRELETKARNRKALGIAAFAGAIALDMLVGGNNSAAARNLLLVGGAASMKSGFDLAAQTDIHVDALRELGASFEAEAEPMVLDVEGETVRLTGSAETQYAAWRGLLGRIYLEETGLGDPAGALQQVSVPAGDTAAPRGEVAVSGGAASGPRGDLGRFGAVPLPELPDAPP